MLKLRQKRQSRRNSSHEGSRHQSPRNTLLGANAINIGEQSTSKERGNLSRKKVVEGYKISNYDMPLKSKSHDKKYQPTVRFGEKSKQDQSHLNVGRSYNKYGFNRAETFRYQDNYDQENSTLQSGINDYST